MNWSIIHDFSPSWSSLIVEVLATIAKFLLLYYDPFFFLLMGRSNHWIPCSPLKGFLYAGSQVTLECGERADSAVKLVSDFAPNKTKISYSDLNLKINKFLHIKWQQLFLIASTFGKWRSTFRKIKKGISHNILIMCRSHKAYILLYTQTRTTTTEYKLSIPLHILRKGGAFTHQKMLFQCK